MPFTGKTIMSEKEEFVRLERQEGANRRELCRRYGISAQLGYKLLKRYEEEGAAGLKERSRRPKRSPGRTAEAVEKVVERLRQEHPS